MVGLEVVPAAGLPEVGPGDDLAALIAGAVELREGDVVVVASKVVAKAEGAFVAVDPAADQLAARRAIALREARRVVVSTPGLLVTETPHGLVCAAGGIDASNVPGDRVLRLPADPDASARALRAALAERPGVGVAVVVTDTFGRPWRGGVVDVAIGCAGLPPYRDERGEADREGRSLAVTIVALADEVAAAADLVRRKADGVPLVVVRGLAGEVAAEDGPGAAALARSGRGDLFPHGRGFLAHALGGTLPGPAGLHPGPLARWEVEAVTAAGHAAGADVAWEGLSGGQLRITVRAGDARTAGFALGRVQACLVDLGYDARVDGEGVVVPLGGGGVEAGGAGVGEPGEGRVDPQ